jgi:thiamine biosynthesis lipoprotein
VTSSALDAGSSPARAAYVEQVKGLPVSVHVRGPRPRADPAAAAVEAAFGELRRADALFSTYRRDSQVSRINAGLLRLDDAHEDVHEVLHLAARAETLTAGLFSVRLPRPGGNPVLDPSGVVKGWAAARAFDVLRNLEDHDVCLNAGGDVVVRTLDGWPGWRVGIEQPGSRGLLGVLEARAGAVATSGTAARGHHLVDPRDGSVADGLASMTVVGPSLLWADVLATAAFVRGADAVIWLRRFPGYAGVSLERTGHLDVSQGLDLLPG